MAVIANCDVLEGDVPDCADLSPQSTRLCSVERRLQARGELRFPLRGRARPHVAVTGDFDSRS